MPSGVAAGNKFTPASCGTPSGSKARTAAMPISIPAELTRTLKRGDDAMEVRAIKAMLNLVMRAVLDSANTHFDPATDAAVRSFQRSERLGTDGKVGKRTYSKLLQAYRYHYRLHTDQALPPWLRSAYGEIGQAEMKGSASNPRIVEYLNTCPALKNAHTKTKQVPVLNSKTGKPKIAADGKPRTRTVWDTTSPTYAECDETAWCAAFINWCLKKSGLPGLDTSAAGLAEAWLDYGMPISSPRYGAIAVIYNPSAANSALTTTGNHVGFLIDGGFGDSIVLLGGNQGNRVRLSRFVGWQIKGFIWPASD